MINYYFKYLELIDTVFLAFKKKPLGQCFLPSVLLFPQGIRSVLACFPPFCHGLALLLSTQRENQYRE